MASLQIQSNRIEQAINNKRYHKIKQKNTLVNPGVFYCSTYGSEFNSTFKTLNNSLRKERDEGAL